MLRDGGEKLVEYKMRKVYIASDGKEFLDKEEAKKYEEYMKGFRYYIVRAEPELTERGTLQKTFYVAVKPHHNMGHDLMMEDYLYRRYGSTAAYVQGVARTQKWLYAKVDSNKIPEGTEILYITEDDLQNISR